MSGAGTLTTRPLTMRDERLQLNVELRGGEGEVTVALLDEAGHELPGFSFAESIPIVRDSVRASVRWKLREDVSSVRGRTVHVGLRVQGSAIVYALAFARAK